MRVTCIQMEVLLAKPDRNFAHAAQLIRQAMEDKPDVVVLPEAWNTSFFPRENMDALCDADGKRVKEEIGALAREFSVNIVAGSVSNLRGGKLYNTAMVFDRSGVCIASYDKTHLFSPMGEDKRVTPGDHLCRFTMDGVICGLIICYDIRFPELVRSLTVPGLDMLFVVSQWPQSRTAHLLSLTTARAIENQMFVVGCNAPVTPGKAICGGNSAIVDPWGQTLAQAGEYEERITAECDLNILQEIRGSIPVFRDRRPDLYRI